MITVRSTINLAHQSVPNIIPVVQGDTGRAILFTLADFTIPEGATARYFVMKPSGLAVYNDATIDGNTVLVELTAQSIIETGDNYGQVRISVGEDIVTSFDFILHVDHFRGIDAIESEAELNIFDQAVEEAVDDARERMEEAAEETTASIPEDYTALSNDVTALKQELNIANNVLGEEVGIQAYIEWVSGSITTNTEIIDINTVVTTTVPWWHQVIPCSKGDTFHVKIDGASSSHRPWTFIASDGTKLSSASANVIDVDITAPTNSAYLVVNSKDEIGTVYDKGNSRIDNIETQINKFVDVCVEASDISCTSGIYVNPNTGAISSTTSNYAAIAKVAIPQGCSRIEFDDVDFNNNSNAGWATYTASSGTSTYVRGGQTKYIDVQDTDIAFAVCTYYENTAPSKIQVKYIYGNINERISQQEVHANTIDETIYSIKANQGILSESVTLELEGVYVNSTTGAYSSIDTYNAHTRVKIPDGCKRILFPDIHFNFSGTAGWATYSGSQAATYLRGGQTPYIDVQNTDKYFGISSYQRSSVTIIYIMDTLSDYIHQTKYPFRKKIMTFVGDSITYGLLDATSAQMDNPWVTQVGEKLCCYVDNNGESSATLMYRDDSHKSWVMDYDELPNNYNIVGVMIGINDAYHSLTLGTMEDRTADTFYGALHVFWLGMLDKYKPYEDKHLFMIGYPHWDRTTVNLSAYINAMKDVCNYYSIPFLALSDVLGMSVYADTDYIYWNQAGNTHSAHPTQICADLIANAVTAFICRMFQQ